MARSTRLTDDETGSDTRNPETSGTLPARPGRASPWGKSSGMTPGPAEFPPQGVAACHSSRVTNRPAPSGRTAWAV